MSQFWEQYKEVMLNPGHSAAEGSWTLLEFIIFSVVWARIIKPSWQRMLNRLHKDLDAEHGISHEEPDNVSEVNRRVDKP